MTEREYFAQLEMRISREFHGMRDAYLRGFWCDGFLDDRDFIASKDGCRITGRVWIADVNKSQHCWDFTLHLGEQTLVRELIDWVAIMPGEDLTGWLSLDSQTNRVKIDPGAGYADRLPDPK